MEKSRKRIVDYIYYNIGKQHTNFRLCYASKDGRFSKWIPYLDAQMSDWLMSRVNQRELLANELVLDLDDGTWQDYLNLIQKLHINGWKFHAFATKSKRARHIHIFDNKLARQPKLKSKMREILILKYGCDSGLKIDAHMIPIEFVPHWKTGEIKDLIFTNRGGWFDTY